MASKLVAGLGWAGWAGWAELADLVMGSFEISPPLPQLPLNSPNSPQLSPNPGEKKPINSCNKVLQNYSKGFFCFSVGHEKYYYYYYYEKIFFCSFKREP